jgi:hypothetical protein
VGDQRLRSSCIFWLSYFVFLACFRDRHSLGDVCRGYSELSRLSLRPLRPLREVPNFFLFGLRVVLSDTKFDVI